MLKFLFLLASLVGLSVSSVLSPRSVPDPVPPHTAIGGHGEFIHDPVGESGARAIHDVVPGPGTNFVPTQDFFPHPGSNAVVHDVIHDVVPRPGSNAVVHDVTHDVAGAVANDVVHDVVPGPQSHTVVGDVVHDVVPNAAHVVHDVVPASNAVVPPGAGGAGLVHNVVPNPHIKADFHNIQKAHFDHPFSRADNGIGTSLVAPSARYVNPAALKCGLKPEPFIAYQLSRFSYNYPRYAIEQELERRPEIRPAVFALATTGRFRGRYNASPNVKAYGHRNKREAGNIGGCMGEAITLRSFYAYNNYCWLVNPVYQDVTFYNCYQSCSHHGGYGTVNRCEASYVHRKVLAFCAGLPYGKRIGYVSVPIPTSCSCKSYNCS